MDKVLVVFAYELCTQLRSLLTQLPIEVYFADTLAALTDLVEEVNVFQVVVVPAILPPEITWWELSGALASLCTKPETLVCARTADFRLWSSVLDAGGYDVLAEPFSPAELQNAVLHGIESFKKRVIRDETNQEHRID